MDCSRSSDPYDALGAEATDATDEEDAFVEYSGGEACEKLCEEALWPTAGCPSRGVSELRVLPD